MNSIVKITSIASILLYSFGCAKNSGEKSDNHTISSGSCEVESTFQNLSYGQCFAHIDKTAAEITAAKLSCEDESEGIWKSEVCAVENKVGTCRYATLKEYITYYGAWTTEDARIECEKNAESTWEDSNTQ